MCNEVLKWLILLFMSEFQIKGSSKGDSNPRPMALRATALPTELPGHGILLPSRAAFRAEFP